MGDVRHEGLSDDAGKAFAELLVREFGAEQTLTGASCAAYAIQGRLPVAVVTPVQRDALATALRLAAEAGAAVAPWGSGSRMALGYPPMRLDLVVSLERMTRIVAYDPADLTITVEAGLTHAALANTLAPARQMLPLDPPLPERATIGGSLATGIVGLRRSLYGAPREMALGMSVVDASGQPLKAGGSVVKNATGYGMTRLYIGSLGTLCVIAEASFKLTPQPEAEATVLATSTGTQCTLAAARAINSLALRPATIAAMRIAALPELARLAPGHERRELLAIRLPGEAAAVKRAITECENALRQAETQPLMTLEGASQDAFWTSVLDLPALRVGPREALARVTTLPVEIGQALDMAEGLASEHDLRLHWLADMATGTLWLRLSAHDEMESAHDEQEGESLGRDVVFAAALRAVLEALIRRWRLVTTLACPPPMKRTLPLWGADSSGEELMREVKRRFDPDHRLNPGRFVAGI